MKAKCTTNFQSVVLKMDPREILLRSETQCMQLWQNIRQHSVEAPPPPPHPQTNQTSQSQAAGERMSSTGKIKYKRVKLQNLTGTEEKQPESWKQFSGRGYEKR